MKKCFIWFGGLLALIGLPAFAHAQTASGAVDQLHGVLNNVYNEMIPMCSQLIDVCRALAGLGTVFYIGYRVWGKIASAQPIELYPLLRPLVISLLIGIFPQVVGVFNGVLQPTVTYTGNLVKHYNDAVDALLLEQANNVANNPATTILLAPGAVGGSAGWDQYTQPGSTTSGSGGGFWSSLGDGFKFLAGGFSAMLKLAFKFLLSVLLEVLFYAASLCIDTIRTFHLIVLAILGPFAFAFSCFDGTHNSITHWITRYINIYLWLPIANLFGAILGNIQAHMLQLDLARAQSGAVSLFSATDFAYLIFLAIGIVGYFTVPGIANYIVHTHGGNPLAKKVSDLAGMAVSAAAGGATGGAGGAAMATGGSGGAGAAGGGGGGAATAASGASQYNHDRIAG